MSRPSNRLASHSNTLGTFAADHGQQLRLEVHGKCCELPTIRQIMDVADHPSVAVCWNSNDQDLNGEGLEHNFNLVKDRFGADGPTSANSTSATIPIGS